MAGDVLAERIASAGKVHLLDLAVLKERLGPKWARLHPHVQSFFEAAIRRVLKPGDTFCKIDELSYLVMFRELSAAEAEFTCVAIAEEVCTRLFGENEQPVVLRSLVATLSASNSPKAGAGAAEIDAYLEREGKETVVAQSGETASSSLSSSVPERTLRLRLGATPLARVSSRTLKFTYRPIWDTVSHATVTYLCQPLLPLVSGGARPALEFCAAADENEQAFLDRLALLECAD